MIIKILGKLSAFGALAVALLILAFAFEKGGASNLAITAQTSATIIITIIVIGAFLGIGSRFLKRQ